MTSKILSLPDILARCPQKLLRHYPDMLQKMWIRKQARVGDYDPNKLPPIPILVILGSRYGGKSQFGLRSLVGAILDGWASSAT
ncbi:MAG: hypothetical protein LBH41_00645, partial [Rickettsiales bacterium]|nr:hypothetical protein [Rickettsiales bacterium]